MRVRKMGASLCVVASLLGAITVAVVSLINGEQPGPYMDEIFHVPQAQNYCAGNYTHWDPMITTLPGLYLVSVLWVELVARILSLPTLQLCSTANLRFQNSIFVVFNFIIVCWLLKRLHKPLPTSACILTALSISCLPVLYFSSLLYYTDSGAVFSVLVAYALSLSNHHLLAACWSLIAVVFRQTNILWAGFIAGTVFTTRLYKMTTPRPVMVSSPLLLLPSLLPPLWPYMLVCLAFALFLVWNGSVVVGDKTHHQLHLNLPQMFYFVSFSAFFSSPYLLGNFGTLQRFMRDTRRFKWSSALLCTTIAALLSVHYFTYVHPYLLADNRHYPFYVWQRVYQYHDTVKYLLTPFYSVTAVYFISLLSTKQRPLWVLLFSATCLLVLSPQKLLEFRYFIIPHIMLRLHLPPSPSPLPLLLEAGLYLAINTLTVWMFLYKPFHWSGDNRVQRFMW